MQVRMPLKGGMPMAAPSVFTSPVDGTVLPLSQCEDPCFSQGRMGRGVLLLPATHTLLAPADAKVYFAFSTGHAVGLQTSRGEQFILHVGLDTHRLQGAGFQMHVSTGDSVSRGDPLLTFDPETLTRAGFSPVMPFVFCNSPCRLRILKLGPVAAGEDLIMLY